MNFMVQSPSFGFLFQLAPSSIIWGAVAAAACVALVAWLRLRYKYKEAHKHDRLEVH